MSCCLAVDLTRGSPRLLKHSLQRSRTRAEEPLGDSQEVDHLSDREQRRDHEHSRETAFEEGARALLPPRAREALRHARVLPLAGRRAQCLQPRLHHCRTTDAHVEAVERRSQAFTVCNV